MSLGHAGAWQNRRSASIDVVGLCLRPTLVEGPGSGLDGDGGYGGHEVLGLDALVEVVVVCLCFGRAEQWMLEIAERFVEETA